MTRVVTDTTCGLPFSLTRQLDIPMIAQIINFDDQSYREGIDIDFAGFMARLSQGPQQPKTAAPYVSDFIEAFNRLDANHESIVCIHPSAELSGTVRSATVAAQEAFPGADIRVIDTQTIAGPLGMMVLAAGDRARAGAGADEVEAAVRELMPRARIYFVVDTLEFLRRGGRIGGAAALVGSLLQIKPILTFSNGRVESFERERTKKRALARIRELIAAEAAEGQEGRPVVMHTGGDGVREAEELAEDIKDITGATEVMLMELVPAIVTHAGPGALAVSFFTPARQED